MCSAWQAQGLRHVSKYGAGTGVREGCKNVGRPGGFEEAHKRCVSRGRRTDFVCCRCLMPSMQNPWKGCKFQVTEVLFGSDHFAWQLQEFVCLGLPFSW